ncbi:MAG: rod shape-determining protein RodA [bacterium]
MAALKKTRFSFFDWFSLLLVVLIGAMGILTLYSATQGAPGQGGIPIHEKQGLWWAMGILGVILLLVIDYRHLEHFAYAIYGVSLLLVGQVLLFGRSISGARRWIELGFFQFQPSELTKLTLILALAKYFHHHRRNGPYGLFQLTVPFVLFAAPFVLVLLEPDLGTSIILMLIFFSILFFVGLSRGAVMTLFTLGAASLPLGWFCLKDYQKDRILTYLDPSRDPLGSGYHILQSKIAIGSGGLWGKGLLHGTQARLHFLPEQHTDFIFSVFAEEWGFFGSLLLLTAYLVIILWIFNMSSRAKDAFGMIVSLGIAFLLFWHVSINIAMGVGLLPVVGIPLPLFSYGGSFLLMVLLGIGLLLNIYVRRFVF